MKTQIKDIVIGIFAVIGFTAVVMGFTNQTEPQQVTYGTPESHVWDLRFAEWSTGGTGNHAIPYLLNKVTGEVRKYDNNDFFTEKDGTYGGRGENNYLTMIEAKAVPKN